MFILRMIALAAALALSVTAQAQTEWEYLPMNDNDPATPLQNKGIVCREGGSAGLAVRRAPTGSKRFLIVMGGGGACYSEESCKQNPKSFTREEFTTLRGRELNMGVFYRTPNNPFSGVHQVFIPYCSGDMHAGASDDYFNGHEQKYRGWANAEIYFDEIITQLGAELAQPGAEVMLLGQSAGGYGAMFNMPRLREKLRAISPQIKLTLVDESAPLNDTSLVTSCFADGWRDFYGFGDTFLQECPSCNATSNWLTAWHEHLLASYPDVSQALLASSLDYVITEFLRTGWAGCESKPVVNAQRYAEGLSSIRARMQRARVQYGAATATYFVTAPIVNLVHIFTTYPYYYSLSAKNPYGTSVRLQDWLSSLYGRRPTSSDDIGPL